jgi:hypothetical protein
MLYPKAQLLGINALGAIIFDLSGAEMFFILFNRFRTKINNFLPPKCKRT